METEAEKALAHIRLTQEFYQPLARLILKKIKATGLQMAELRSKYGLNEETLDALEERTWGRALRVKKSKIHLQTLVILAWRFGIEFSIEVRDKVSGTVEPASTAYPTGSSQRVMELIERNGYRPFSYYQNAKNKKRLGNAT